MAIVTSYTAARMKAIEDASVVGGHVDENGDLILQRNDGQYLLGGHVAGTQGQPGEAGPPGVADSDVLDDIFNNIGKNTDDIAEVVVTPKAVTNLVLIQNGAVFLPDGSVQTQVYLMWDLVVSSLDNKPIGAVEYRIWASTGSDPVQPLINAGSEAEYVLKSLQPGITVNLAVQAKSINGTVWGGLSNVLVVTTLIPPQNPAILTAPTLSSNLGLVFANWDGTFFDAAKPVEFAHVLTEYSADGGTSWSSVGLPGYHEGQVATIREPLGTNVSARLRWVDTLGRISEPSASGSTTVIGIGTLDLADQVNQAIDQANATASSALASVMSTISSVVIEYALNSSEVTAPTTGWSTSAPTRTAGTFIWTRTTTTHVDNTSETSDPVLMTGNTGPTGNTGLPGTPGTDGSDGAPGAPGKGMSSTTITYQVGTSGVVAPTGTWQATPQSTTVGQYLWTRTVITWTDSTNTTSYSVAAHGSTGATGSAGRGMQSTATTYQVSTSGTATPSGTWVANPPATPPGEFLWTRTIITWSDSTTSTAYSVAKQGLDGQAGADGADGNGIASTTITYQASASGTTAPTGTWSATIPSVPAGHYLWTRTVIIYDDATTSTLYAVGRSGTNGANGAPGADGADGQTSYLHTAYATNSTGTAGFSTSDPAGATYLGTYTDFVPADSTDPTKYTWVLIQGPKGTTGSTGPTGKGISSSSVVYQLSASGTTVPTGAWVSSPPTLVTGQYLWTRTTITFTDAATQISYSVAYQGVDGTDGTDGADGTNGRGITSTVIAYQVAASGTTAPSGSWLSTVPSVPLGQFLWTRTLITYTDSSTSTSYAIGHAGTNGANGTPGAPGADGTDGTDGKTSYLHTAYSTSATGSTGFSTTDPTGATYLGTYTDFTAADSSTPSDYTWALIQGPKGSTGSTGPTGKGISSSSVDYQASASGTTTPTGAWVASPPAVPTGQYLWTRTVIVFSDAATQTSYSVAHHGTNGSTGATGVGVSGTAVTYQVSSSGTTAPTGTWSSTIPSVPAGQYLWTRTITSYTNSTTATAYSVGRSGTNGTNGAPGTDGTNGQTSYLHTAYATNSNGTAGFSTTDPSGKTYLGTYTDFTAADSTNPALYTWVLIQGPKGSTGGTGPTGKGISSSSVDYQVSSSGTTTPTGSWVTSPPALTAGQYLWTRTTITFTDAATQISYSVAYQGTNGTNGSTGPTGVGVSGTAVTYQASASGTTAPTTWLSTIPSVPLGQYLWTRTVISYTNSTSSTSYSVSHAGTNGSNGAPGSPGSDGQTSYLHTAYSTSATGSTGFSTTNPTGATYLGTYADFIAADSNTPSAYTWVLIQGPKGATGNPGSTGPTGKGISSSAVVYQASASGTTTPTGTWLTTVPSVPVGQYLWTRTTITFTDGASQISYSVAHQGTNGSNGATGGTGPAGKSVSSVTPYYILVGTGNTAPAKPTANPPGGSWSLFEPGYNYSTELYRTELIVYSDNSFAYTNVSKVSAYTAATQAVTVANLADAAAKGMVKASSTDPGHQVGRIWLVLNGSGQVIGVKISNGSTWSSYLIMADQILVPSSVGTVSIANGAITASKIVVGDYTNIAAGSDFENVHPWTLYSQATIDTSQAHSGTKSLKIDSSKGVGNAATLDTYVSTTLGEVWVVEYWMYRDDLWNGTGNNSKIRLADQNGALLGAFAYAANSAPANVWRKLTGTLTINSGTINQLKVTIPTGGTAGNAWLDDIVIRRKSDGQLIVDGSIKTNQLNATEIWANQAWLDVLRAGVIETSMVTATFGEELNIGSNSMINLIIDNQSDNAAAAAAAQDAADDAQAAANDAASSASTAQSSANDANTAIAAVDSAQQETRDSVDKIQTWFRVDEDGAHMGKTDSPFQTHMKPDRFEITFNDEVTTYWEAGRMMVPSAVVDEIVLANHQFQTYTDGGTIIKVI